MCNWQRQSLPYPQEHYFLGQPTVFCPDKCSVSVKVRMDHWWNDTDRGNPKHCKRNLSQCHKAHDVWSDPGWNPGIRCENSAKARHLSCNY